MQNPEKNSQFYQLNCYQIPIPLHPQMPYPPNNPYIKGNQQIPFFTENSHQIPYPQTNLNMPAIPKNYMINNPYSNNNESQYLNSSPQPVFQINPYSCNQNLNIQNINNPQPPIIHTNKIEQKN